MASRSSSTTSQARPSADLSALRTRDLGNLRDRPVQRPTLAWHLRNWLHYRRRDLPKLASARLIGWIPGLLRVECQLSGVVYRPDLSRLAPEQLLRLQQLLRDNVSARELPRYFGGQALDYGVLSTRVITDAGVAYLVDAFQNLVEIDNMRYHGFGTGTNAEAAGNTALQTELTTQYATDNTRPTGTQTENAANIYETVATLSPDSGGTLAITEHGLFSATSAGTLWDRSVFSAINVVAASDSLQVTHRTTCASGG